MTEPTAMAGFDWTDEALEAALVDLGRAIDYPPMPDVAPAVGHRLRAAPVTRSWPSGGRWSLRWAIVAALLALALLAGAAIGFGWRLPGLEITFGGPTPTAASPSPSTASAPPTPSPRPLIADLGPAVSIDAARAAVSFQVFVPTAASLGATEVHVDPRVRGGEVVIASSGGLIVTESLGRVEEEFLGKVLGPDTTVTEVVVNGRAGLWIEGQAHALFILDERGERREETLRMVGNVLAWAQDGTLIRIEGATTLARAQEIAGSMR